jgi:molecular chaperone GrpE
VTEAFPTEGSANGRVADGEGPNGPVVRDRRRLDPSTGQVREQPRVSDAGEAPAAAQSDTRTQPAVEPDAVSDPVSDAVLDDVSAVQGLADELRGDLLRLQAEYVNYRKRVERDRDVARDTGRAGVLEALLPVLDDLHFAREHGDLVDGPFAAIAEKLEAALARLGLERYGAAGEPFDPAVHEALMHSHSPDVTETTVVTVLQPGYRLGERTLRPARVAVADPE